MIHLEHYICVLHRVVAGWQLLEIYLFLVCCRHMLVVKIVATVDLSVFGTAFKLSFMLMKL